MLANVRLIKFFNPDGPAHRYLVGLREGDIVSLVEMG